MPLIELGLGQENEPLGGEMEVKYINPFINAAQTVFKTMLNIDAKMGKPILKNEKTTSGDISGIMAVSYTHLRAHETVLELVCRLLLEKKKEKQEKILSRFSTT